MDRLAYVSEASKVLLAEGFTKSGIANALGMLGRGAGVDRVYIFEDGSDANGERVTSQRYEWVAPGVTPQIDDPACQNMPYAIFGVGRAASLVRGNVVTLNTRDCDSPELAEILTAQSIKSILLCPIVHEGATWGFVGFDDCKRERVWPVEEINALRAFARAMTATFKHAAMRATLAKARDQLKSIL